MVVNCCYTKQTDMIFENFGGRALHIQHLKSLQFHVIGLHTFIATENCTLH